MQYENVIKDFKELPEIAKQEVADFITFLKIRYFSQQSERQIQRISLREDPFVGLWKERSDLQDSTNWIRTLRKKDWETNELTTSH